MENQLNELQSMLLEIFHWFHGFCVKHGLRYYMLGGTMLGAVRHQGFVPWDDDIDVGMPRVDYDRFAQLMQSEENKRYVLETPEHGGVGYYYPFSKLYDTQTTLIENTKYKIKRGIFLDIFPLDGIGDSKAESMKNYREIKWKYNLLLTRVAGIRRGRSALKNAAVLGMRMVPERWISGKSLCTGLVSACRKRAFDECQWVGNLVGAWREREIMPRAVFGEPRLYSFEQYKVYGVTDFETYLTMLYGAWRELPPVEKRKTHHDFLCCDLKKPYQNET